MAARNLTEGRISWLVPQLAYPFMVTFALNSAYGLADSIFVGRLGGAALAGLGISLNSMFLQFAFGDLLGSGALALLSQAFGAGNHARVRIVFQQAVCITVAVGLTLSWVMATNAPRFIRVFSADDAVLREGIAFLVPYSATFFTQSLLIVSSVCFRALGDFRLPGLVISGSVVLNIALDPLLIFGWGPFPALGITGAGYAAVIAQGTGVLAFAVMLFRTRGLRLLVFERPLYVDWKIQRILLRIGAPAGLQQLLLAGSIIFAFAMFRPFGPAATAGFGLGLRLLNSMLQTLGVSLGVAVASLVGQNYGARRQDRVRAAIAWGLGIFVACFTLIYALILWNPSAWFIPFTQNGEIREFAGTYLVMLGSAIPFFGISIITLSASQGLGRNFPPLIASVVNFTSILGGIAALQAVDALTPARLFLVAALALDAQSIVMGVVLVGIWRRLGEPSPHQEGRV